MQCETHDRAGLLPGVEAFRKQYRETVVGPYYSGIAHLLFVLIGCVSIIAACAWFSYGEILENWEVFPATFIIANFVEYLGHRYPMHRRFKSMGLMYHRHVKEHHAFFNEEHMIFRSPRDYKIVLFPPIMLFFYFGIIAAPVGLLLLYLYESPAVAALYVAMAMFYFLQYETLHFCYHLDDDAWISRLPVIRTLREHHRVHHHRHFMSKFNFNITWPIADVAFGTLRRSLDAGHQGNADLPAPSGSREA